MTNAEILKALVEQDRITTNLAQEHSKATDRLIELRMAASHIIKKTGPVSVGHSVICLDTQGVVKVVHGKSVDMIERTQFLGAQASKEDDKDGDIPF